MFDLNRCLGVEGAEPGRMNARGWRNIALASEGARVRAWQSNIDPRFLLYDPYYYPTIQPFTSKTIPACVQVMWGRERVINAVAFYGGNTGDPDAARRLPLDYRLQYWKSGKWVDLIPPVSNAVPCELDEGLLAGRNDLPYRYGYLHTFEPISTTAIWVYITRSNDPGTRGDSPQEVVPTDEREIILRRIEVFAGPER